MSKKGVDLSEWNTGLDYTTLAKSIEFAILREGYRQSQDKMFNTHLGALRALQVPILAVYHFIYAKTVEEARAEARSCIKNVEAAGLPKDTMIFADFEDDTFIKAKAAGVELGAKEINDFTLAFCDEVDAAGYPSGIYTNSYYLKVWYDPATIEGRPLWLAHYGIDKPSRPCLIWQSTNKGRLAGYDGDIDIDYYYDSIEEDELTDGESGMEADPIETATLWMEGHADDPAHGYDQIYRWGEKGDFDCSSAVISAWEAAGIPVKTAGATYTGNMKKAFLACGFADVTKQVDLATGKGLVRGDVLLNETHHTAMYIGDGKEVEASINERGTATGGQPGDQTGKEFLVKTYKNYPWDCVLRFASCEGGACPVNLPSEPAPAPVAKYTFTLPDVRKGSTGSAVRLLQTILRGAGYLGLTGKPLGIDGEFGDYTSYAVKTFQKNNSLEVDGIVGRQTWTKLIMG